MNALRSKISFKLAEASLLIIICLITLAIAARIVLPVMASAGSTGTLDTIPNSQPEAVPTQIAGMLTSQLPLESPIIYFLNLPEIRR